MGKGSAQASSPPNSGLGGPVPSQSARWRTYDACGGLYDLARALLHPAPSYLVGCSQSMAPNSAGPGPRAALCLSLYDVRWLTIRPTPGCRYVPSLPGHLKFSFSADSQVAIPIRRRGRCDEPNRICRNLKTTYHKMAGAEGASPPARLPTPSRTSIRGGRPSFFFPLDFL